MKNGKRILKVKVSRILEQGADSSYLDQDIEGFAERKRQFEAGLFDFIGIKAEAEITLTIRESETLQPYSTLQTIHSSGLWGIESDSDAAYLKEIESEQLAELKTELTALGFSKRAIAKAFQNIERKDS